MMNRRKMLQGAALGAGAVLCSSLLPGSLHAATPSTGGAKKGPKRVVFFLQNHGFPIESCIPTDLKKSGKSGMSGMSGSLLKTKLPENINPLEPYKERLHIIDGLHGIHATPSHSAFFGALGGYRGQEGTPPLGSTIDYEISKLLPQTLLPHLCIGMDTLDAMVNRPTVANLSASGAGKPIFMHSNPNHLHQMLYGNITQDDVGKQNYTARSNLLQSIESLAVNQSIGLPTTDKILYDQFVQGFKDMNGLRERLKVVSNHLRKFAPKVDERYSRPQFETDWHEALLEIGISALTSGITNVLTIGSGRGTYYGSWKGLGVETEGHTLGHTNLATDPNWVKIRQYNSRMLVQIMQALEKIPEDGGTMMDHTLIVYTSNNADAQHTNGQDWPMMLLGNFNGKFKTGCFTKVEGKRPINALYATILAAIGHPCDRFNMSDKMALKFDSGIGPIKELLA